MLKRNSLIRNFGGLCNSLEPLFINAYSNLKYSLNIYQYDKALSVRIYRLYLLQRGKIPLSQQRNTVDIIQTISSDDVSVLGCTSSLLILKGSLTSIVWESSGGILAKGMDCSLKGSDFDRHSCFEVPVV